MEMTVKSIKETESKGLNETSKAQATKEQLNKWGTSTLKMSSSKRNDQ